MQRKLSIGVVGAGVAGSRCAQVLSAAGHAVTVWDKARGPGGRLATRIARWTDAQGQARETVFDHGAAGFSAQTPAFKQGFVAPGAQAGWLSPGAPSQQNLAGNPEAPMPAASWVPASPQPSVCRALLAGSIFRAGATVQAIHRDEHGWRIELAEASSDNEVQWDALLLALPPAQLEPLLAPHQSAWARQAALVPMHPCWTLMAVSDAPADDSLLTEGRPRPGPLAQVLRQDHRPGRQGVRQEAHWVVHAGPAWSREHLEHEPACVQAQMQQALAEHTGQPLVWRYATVHRWRYAQVAAAALHPLQPSANAWWCAQRRLGACGDWLGGGGVEGAWLSGTALAASLLQSEPVTVSMRSPHLGRAAGVAL